jgi:hypothetical protein
VDESEILRVGGQLSNAVLNEQRKHPIIVPKQSNLAVLIARNAHETNLHAGPGLMENIIRENFWIPTLKQIIKQLYRKCIKCIRFKAQTMSQVMADLSPERVNCSPIFSHIGVGLAGPIEIKASRIRNSTTIKHCIALFICLATKIVHLELLTGLSTQSFLEGFTRFVARRGMTETILSDNGTNFVGANRMLKETWDEIKGDCQAKLALKGINWKFIPSLTPSFGGIWEANIKSMKMFLKKAENTKQPVLYEYYTLLCSIEALLNSRPLCALSDDPNEITALTPAHFAIQRSLLFPPKPSSPK